MVFIIFYLINR